MSNIDGKHTFSIIDSICSPLDTIDLYVYSLSGLVIYKLVQLGGAGRRSQAYRKLGEDRDEGEEETDRATLLQNT